MEQGDHKLKFSIIVPCYNQAMFLEECIESVLNQDYRTWELLIVNDGSTDDTVGVATKFLKDGRIKLINKENGGLSSARNLGLKYSGGDVMLFLDSDDVLLPGCLRVVYSTLSTNKDIDILQTGYAYIDEKTSDVKHKVSPAFNVNYQDAIFAANLGPVLTLFTKKKIVDSIGMFDESLKSAEDWDFWMRTIKAGAKVVSIPTVTSGYRYVANSMSRNAFRMYEALKTVALRAPRKDTRILVDSIFNIERDIDMRPTIKRMLLTCMGVSVMQGKVEESVHFFKSEAAYFAIQYKPSDFAQMYSYLTFRYWTDRTSIHQILSEYYPNYVLFFDRLGYTKLEKSKALNAIFAPVYKARNRNLFGRYLGGVMNYVNGRLK